MMIGKTPFSAVVAGFVGAFMALSPAAAQTNNAETPAPPAAAGDAWLHICTKDPNGGKDVCLVTQEVRTEQGQFVASSSVRSVKGEDKKALLIAVPPGTLLEPGIRVQIDESKQVPGKYTICLPNACYAELEIDNAFIANMKKGNNLIVSVINNQAKAVGIGLTLVGFTKAIEGPPIDSAELEKRRQALQDGLKARAEKARQEQQNGAAEKPKAQ